MTLNTFGNLNRMSVLIALLCVFALGLGSPLAQTGDDSTESAEGVTTDTEDDTTEDTEASDESADEDSDEEVVLDDDGPLGSSDATADLGPAIGLSVLGTVSLTGGIVYLANFNDSQVDADAARAVGELDRAAQLEDRADREKVLGITLTSVGVALLGVATYLWIDHFNTPPALDDDVVFVVPSIPTGGGLGLEVSGFF